jgi:hypothetical protein
MGRRPVGELRGLGEHAGALFRSGDLGAEETHETAPLDAEPFCHDNDKWTALFDIIGHMPKSFFHVCVMGPPRG